MFSKITWRYYSHSRSLAIEMANAMAQVMPKHVKVKHCKAWLWGIGLHGFQAGEALGETGRLCR